MPWLPAATTRSRSRSKKERSVDDGPGCLAVQASGHAAPYLGHRVRLVASGDGQGHARVTLQVARFAGARVREERDLVTLKPNPHRDAVGRAIGKDRGKVGVIGAVEQGAHGVGQAGHGCSPSILDQYSGGTWRHGEHCGYGGGSSGAGRALSGTPAEDARIQAPRRRGPSPLDCGACPLAGSAAPPPCPLPVVTAAPTARMLVMIRDAASRRLANCGHRAGRARRRAIRSRPQPSTVATDDGLLG
jgi:hypothetical protein